jgi:hypothetical protein
MCKKFAKWTLSLHSFCTLHKVECFGPDFFIDLMFFDSFFCSGWILQSIYICVSGDFDETRRDRGEVEAKQKQEI